MDPEIPGSGSEVPSAPKTVSIAVVVGAIIGLVILGVGIIFFITRVHTATPPAEEAEIPVATTTAAVVDPATLVWNEVTEPTPWDKRDAGASFVLNGKMFLMGGVLGGAIENINQVKYWEVPHANDIWSTTDGVRWVRETEHAAWRPRRSLSVIYFHDKLWMLGGWQPNGGYENDIWTSLDGVHWFKQSEKTPFEPREGQTLNEFQGKLWMIGGVNFDKNKKTYNDVWYSSDGLHWQEIATTSPFAPRYDHAVEVYKGRMWLTGGLDHGVAKGDEWVTDNGSDWQKVTDTSPWETRHGHQLLTFKGLLWLVSGWDTVPDVGISDTWYSDDGINWHKTTQDASWLGREDHQTVVFNDRMWFFTGMNRDYHWTNDIWYSSFATTTSATSTNQ